MTFWAFLNQWWNLPYLVMLGLVGAFFLLQALGLVTHAAQGEHDAADMGGGGHVDADAEAGDFDGDADADVDADVQLDGDAEVSPTLAWLYTVAKRRIVDGKPLRATDGPALRRPSTLRGPQARPRVAHSSRPRLGLRFQRACQG